MNISTPSYRFRAAAEAGDTSGLVALAQAIGPRVEAAGLKPARD